MGVEVSSTPPPNRIRKSLGYILPHEVGCNSDLAGLKKGMEYTSIG
ncbi:hypothetical protein FM113_13735 [Leucobacter sp. 7(1)]|nr:hypothetical protein FM113_13735 [Leucobacter sp. 7(1)]